MSPNATIPKSLILTLATIACFMVILDTTIVNVAIESIRESLHASLSGLQWVVDGYGLTFASFLLSAGALADRVGPRKAFGWGLWLFSLASLACGLAPNLPTLIAARGFQGAGAALLIPTSLALISRTFLETSERSRALGIWGGIGGGMALVAGPLFGGLLTQSLGWRSVFLINVPIGVAGLILLGRIGTDDAAVGKRGLDLPGQALAVLGLSALTFFFIEGPSLGWNAPFTLIAGTLAVIGGAGFLWVESRSSDPMLPLGLFRSRDVSLASATGLALNFAFYGQLFFLNVYLQKGLGLNPAQAGLRFLPETAGALLFAFLANRVLRGLPPRTVVIVGTSISALGMIGLSLFGLQGHTAVDLPILAMIGMGIATPPFIIAVMLGAVPHERAGIASGALNAGRQVGGLLGVAMLGALVGHSNAESVRMALGLAAIVMAGGVGMALMFRRTEVSAALLKEAAAEAMA